MGENEIYVKMLGSFSMEYRGKSFTIERNSATKVNQLLQILLYFDDGIPREQLISYLFNDEIVTNPSNSLRALVFRLRKVLTSSGLPDDEFVHISRGTYSWTRQIPVKIDAKEFMRIAEDASKEKDKEKRKKLLLEACDIYGGDFLPMLAGLEWAISIEVTLKKVYSRIVDELCQILLENKEFELLLKVSEKAAGLYPYNEWQGYQMQALIELGRKKEALKLYEETETLMFEELGVSVSHKMTEQLDRLGNQILNGTDMISVVQRNLDTAKKEEEGAFLCTYPVFIESYRYMKRVISRTGQSAWLMLITICDGKGFALEPGDRLDILSSELQEAISTSVRSGDMYTRYSDNQFLLLLLGLTKEDCSIVEKRINGNMEKDSRKRYLQYHLAPVSVKTREKSTDEEMIDKIFEGLE